MGTNYYLNRSVCEHCGRGGESTHIGKSICGWAFALHVNRDVRTLDAWEALFRDPDNNIDDEYGKEITPDEMMQIITVREHPDGLRRHQVDAYSCVGHGDGTWDYIEGCFS